MYPLLNLRNNVTNVFKAPSASLSLPAVTTTLNFVNYVSPFYYSLAFLNNITTYISIPKEYLFRVACFWMLYLCFHTLYSIFCDFFYSLVYLWDSHVDGWNCSSTMITALPYSILWIYYHLLIHYSVSGLLGCFQFAAVLNNAVVAIFFMFLGAHRPGFL